MLFEKRQKKKRSIKHRKWKGNPPKPCGQLQSRRFAHAIGNALLQAQLIICWSNTHASEVLLLSWAWEMLGGKAGLVLTRALCCPGPRFLPSSSLMLRMQSTGGFAKILPEILQTPSNGTWTEQLTDTQPVYEPCGTTIALMTYGSSQNLGLSDSPSSLVPLRPVVLNKNRFFFTCFPGYLVMYADIRTWWHYEWHYWQEMEGSA